MTLLAALCSAVAAYFAVGYATGQAPTLRRARRRSARTVPSTATWLTQAGVGLSPHQLWIGSAVAGLVTAGVVAAVTATPVVAVVPGITAAALPRLYLARRRQRRLREAAEAWPDALRELNGALAAGMSLPQALSALSESGAEALRPAFARFPQLSRVLGVAPALESIKEHLGDPTSDRVIEVLILAHERGGRVVGDILRDLAETTSQDVKTREEIATSALEQKLNARAVFVLPWLVLLVLTAGDGPFREFYQSSGGLLVVAAGAALSLLGTWIVGRLAKEPVEPRVLGADRRPWVGGGS
jgi:tight adherence protein B